MSPRNPSGGAAAQSHCHPGQRDLRARRRSGGGDRGDDQLGKPVEAELSLAPVNEGSTPFTRTPPRRSASFSNRTPSGTQTSDREFDRFNYLANTRKVIKEFQDEKERMERKRRGPKALCRYEQLEARQLAMQPYASGFQAMRQQAQQVINAPANFSLPASGQLFQQVVGLSQDQNQYGTNAADGSMV